MATMFPMLLGTARCDARRAGESDLTGIAHVFADNAALLESTACRKSSHELAHDAVFCLNLPMGGERDRAVTYAVRSQGEIVGVLECYSGHPNDRCLYVGSLFLRSHAQRKGFGRELVGKLEECARQAGLTEARLLVNAPNWDALVFWAKLGYREISGVYGTAATQGASLELRKSLVSPHVHR